MAESTCTIQEKAGVPLATRYLTSGRWKKLFMKYKLHK